MRLPPELLCTVVEPLPLNDRMAVTHVCRAWRDVLVHHSPSVWSSLVYESMKEGSLTALLRRSASADLHLELHVRKNCWVEVVRCLEQHLARCTHLKLLIDQRLRTKAARALARALCCPAPRLRTFKVYDHLDSFNHERDPELRLFAGQAARLRLAKMHMHMDAWPHPALPDVEQLLYCHTGELRLSHVENLLPRVQSCRSIGIEIDEWNADDVVSPSALLPLPATLEALLIISNKALVDPAPLLSAMDFAAVPHVHVEYNYVSPKEPALNVLEILAGDTEMRYMHLNSSTNEDSLNVDLWDSYNTPRLHRTATSLPFGAHAVDALFANLTHLLLGELIVALADQIPPLPAVVHLTLQTLAPEYQKTDGHDSAFMLPRTREQVLRCPALRTFRVGARFRGGFTHIAPEMIREFVEWHLNFDAPRLPRLVLRGLCILENVPEEASALLALADYFEIEAGYIAEPRRSADLRDWD